MSTRCILMSIRKEWWQEISTGRKVLEFRTRFPADYRGKVYVYESGKDSRHAVVGSFRVDYVIDADKAKASSHEDWDIIDRLNSDQLNDFFSRKYHAEGSLYAIHVTDVVADDAPMSLEDLSAMLDKPVIRAPQSWQYINIKQGDNMAYMVQLSDRSRVIVDAIRAERRQRGERATNGGIIDELIYREAKRAGVKED